MMYPIQRYTLEISYHLICQHTSEWSLLLFIEEENQDQISQETHQGHIANKQ